MTQWLVWVFQRWENFLQGHAQIVSVIYLLGGKSVFFCLFLLTAWVGTKIYKKGFAPLFDAPWHMGSVAEIFFAFVLFQAAAVCFKAPFLDSENLEGILAVWAVIEYLFLFVLVWFVLRFVLKRNLAHAGWRLGGIKKDARTALGGVVFICLVAFFTNFLYWTEILTPTTKIIREVSPAEIFSKGVFSLIEVFLVLLISPLCEETFYRGFVYPVLRNRFPKVFAIATLSLFFAAVHFQWNYFLLLFLMSYSATLAYEKTHRLGPPVVIHSFYNLLILLGYFRY